MFCKNCGQEVREGAKFCTKCGRKMTDVEGSYRKSYRGKSHKGAVIAIAVTLVSLLAVIAGGLLIRNIYTGKEEKKAVADFLESYQKLDEEKCTEYLYTNNVYPQTQEFSQLQKRMAETMKFRITGVKKEEGYTVVKVKISNIDFENVMETILDNNMTEEKAIETKVEEIITSGEAKIKEYSCEVNVYKVEDERKIEMTESLSNALLGGFPEYIYSLTQEG